MFKRHLLEKVLSGEKTQTRRISKRKYKIGKEYRLRKDWYHYYDHRIKIIDRREERLGDITEEDAVREGFNSVKDFKKAWININGIWDPDIIVHVYDFELILSESDKMPTGI